MAKKIPSRAEAEKMFKDLDKSGDGALSPTELVGYLEKHGYSHRQAVAFFDEIDDSDDKKISLEEFVEDICSNPRSDALNAIFADADKDKSGKLNLEEVKAACKKYGLTDVKALEAGFKKMDKDKSGSVDKEEFIEYMSAHY